MSNAVSPIDEAFGRCRAEGRAAFVAFLTAGYPSLDITPDLIRAAAEGGADIIEVGFPYSDPVADGPIIQASSQQALANGATFDAVLEAARLARSPVPLLAFTYYNPLFVRGLERSAEDLRSAGFAGAIVPDLPIESAAPLMQALTARGLTITFVVAPTTPAPRAERIARFCDGFVYVAGRTGVTGTHKGADGMLSVWISELRRLTDKPLAVGFGIANPEQASAVIEQADGFVVGSALIEACGAPEPIAAVRELCARFGMQAGTPMLRRGVQG
ncbi:MAG: tryptophan synthase subunit alpha [Candidatus Eremiobacteraeota bacterium]|nr:tryptophan synthase subunit alpha [Candidatus Eremiobacteraeota bacterium]